MWARAGYDPGMEPVKESNPSAEALSAEPEQQDPSAVDPAADEKVQLQLAIFEVTRDARGKDLADIQDRLRAEFTRRGVATPPGTWLESVASAAFYGQPYLIDLPSAVAADSAVPAPDQEIRERLESRRKLRREKLPPGIFPDASEWEVRPDQVTPAWHGAAGGPPSNTRTSPGWASRPLLAAAGMVAALLVTAAVWASRRRR